MPSGKPHSAELKAAAVAAVASGEQPASVARRFGVSQGRLKEWCDQLGPRPSGTFYARTREELAELAYDAIAATLKSIAARAEVTGRKDWAERQDASQLAALAAAEWDRVIRMVAGFRPAEEPALPEPIDADDLSSDAHPA